ncbi:MAG: RNA 2',3'-cyclic phosphodiesterase [Bacteroidia bacterium]|nr:RNA 2',3'-cyclic phosphodiesterase [Bacteroidia bacterium]MDW8235653.1 RNA 2',3'-cyclic phosphodiesterase [Bacteroidia bacterium]
MRLFIAAPLPPEAIEFIQTIRPATLPPQARWLPPASWHLTLLFLGETPQEKVPAIDSTLQQLIPSHSSFTLVPYQIGWKDYTLWIWLQPNPSAETLVKNLHTALGMVEPQRLLPHITIARRKNRPPDTPKPLRQGMPITFQEVVLYQSILRPEGAQYIPLRCYPLSATE